MKRVRDSTSRETATGDHIHGSQSAADRRALRFRYLAVKNLIGDERDDIGRVDSDAYRSAINKVDQLHQSVQKPREQVADAEALRNIADALVTLVKSQTNQGVTPSDFVTALMKNFGQQAGRLSLGNGGGTSMLRWADLGISISHIFRTAPGCHTMMGPMNAEMKQRKAAVRRRWSRTTESTHPQEFDDAKAEGKTNTDKNMLTMFDVLKKNKNVKLEKLVLNRNSFAQTIENIFALSFLVKEGKAEISLNDNGDHMVSPRNAPSSSAVKSKEAPYHHFVFRFDYMDWKLMMETVGPEEELMMPHREAPLATRVKTQEEAATQSTSLHTPMRKFTRNHGIVHIEQSNGDRDLLEKDDYETKVNRRLYLGRE